MYFELIIIKYLKFIWRIKDMAQYDHDMLDAVWAEVKDVLENNKDFADVYIKFRFNVCEHF